MSNCPNCCPCCQKSSNVEHDIEILIKALKFYTNETYYKPASRFVNGEIHDYDRGSIAQKALNQINRGDG